MLAVAGLLVCARRSHLHAETTPPAAPANLAPWSAEVSVGYGAAIGGGAGAMVTRRSPLLVTLGGAVVVRDAPALAAHGAVLLETLDRSAFGVAGGVRLLRVGGGLRLGVSGVGMLAPFTLWGLAVKAGRCAGVTGGLHLCGDLGLTTYVAGSDLAPGQTASQVLLHLGVAFDAS
jgi:hypothetical protein